MPFPPPSADRALLAIALLALTSCMPHSNERPEIHGHRGCRGLLPENSIPAFLQATELGADFLEMDVVITADKQVLVSHEPWMRHGLCRTPDGTPITEDTERHFNLYQMKASAIQAYDCGSEEQADFPNQGQQRTTKPTLREVIEAVDEHALMSGSLAPGFNIEIKSDPALYGEFQPRPAEFAALVLGWL